MEKDKVFDLLITYLKKGNPSLSKIKEIPLDKSLVELGYMDSFGVIDITFIENKWKIKLKMRN